MAGSSFTNPKAGSGRISHRHLGIFLSEQVSGFMVRMALPTIDERGCVSDWQTKMFLID